MTVTDARTTWTDYHDLGCDEGLYAAIAAYSADDAAPLTGPTGYALLPEPAVSVGDVVVARIPLPEGILAAVLRSDPSEEPRVGLPSGFPTLVAAGIRLGVSRRLLRRCLEHLGSRSSGDATVLSHQLVKGAIADAAVRHGEVGATLASLDDAHACAHGRTEPDPDLVALLHLRVTQADREILCLFGASSFLQDGPGQEAYASELLADILTPAAAR